MIWDEFELGELCKIGRGSSPRPISNNKYFEGGDIPWVKIADATSSSKMIYKTKQHVNSYGASFSRILPPGSLILSASGTVGFPKILGVEGCIHDGWLYFDEFKNITKEFLYYKLIDLNEYYYSLSYGGANIQNINTGIARKTKIKLPSIQTQKRIADILSAYDDLIENNLKRIKLLEHAAQNIYKEWFVHMRFPGHENTAIDEETGLPEGWKYGVISDLCEIKSGYAFKSKHWRKEGNPVIKIKNINNNTVNVHDSDFVDDDVAEIANKYELFSGDVVIAMTGATVGKVGLVPKINKRIYLNQRVGLFRPFSENNNNIALVFSFFLTNDSQQQVFNLAQGAAQPNISGSEIGNIKLNIPESKLLSDFNKLVKLSIELIQTLYSKNQKLKAARDILLPRLMNRNIEVE